MNKKHFGEMLGSLDEAVEIGRGTRKPARAYTLSEPDVRAIRRSLGSQAPGYPSFQALMGRALEPGRRGR